MEKWIIPCNYDYYDVFVAFNELNTLDWRQTAKSINTGDEVYIYVGKPYQAIMFKCEVIETNIHTPDEADYKFYKSNTLYEFNGCFMRLKLIEKFDDKKYPLSKLKENGLKGNIQGPRRSLGLI